MTLGNIAERTAKMAIATVIALLITLAPAQAFADDEAILPVQKASAYDLKAAATSQELPSSGHENKPRSLLGYGAAVVLTGSMRSVYPVGSLVVMKSTDVEDIEIGDDITFMTSDSTAVTHRVVGVVEDYKNTGQRAFKTWGVDNPHPDQGYVFEPNVVGKVIFCSPELGAVVTFVKRFWILMIFLLVLAIGLKASLKRICKENPDDASDQERRDEALIAEGKPARMPASANSFVETGARAAPAPR